MLKNILIGMISFLLCTACMESGRIQPRANDHMLDEAWITQIKHIHPNLWLKQADTWFLTGKPNALEKNIRGASSSTGLTLSRVRVPNFTTIEISGDFQVQIVGGQTYNSVYILGSNMEARQVSVTTIKDKLMLSQPPKPAGNLQKVIVRIGIRNLFSLENKGNSLVLGRNILSDHLNVLSTGSGTIFLNGKMNLKRLEQRGIGTITILGAYTPNFQGIIQGNGHVNISGKIGIQHLIHEGNGTVNILGANSDALCIAAAGSGITYVCGTVNLKNIIAKQSSKVYVYGAFSKNISVRTTSRAIVGIAGKTGQLNVETCDTSCFLGQYLLGTTVYVSTKDKSHADISTDQQAFATATHQSGILYYGPPSGLTRFISHQATILTLPASRNNIFR